MINTKSGVAVIVAGVFLVVIGVFVLNQRPPDHGVATGVSRGASSHEAASGKEGAVDPGPVPESSFEQTARTSTDVSEGPLPTDEPPDPPGPWVSKIDENLRLGDIEAILRNQELNPDGLLLDEGGMAGLRALLGEAIELLAPMEQEYRREKHSVLADKARAGEAELMLTDESGKFVSMATQDHPEQAMGYVFIGDKNYAAKLDWGERPEFDAQRMALIHTKHNVKKSIAGFISANGKS